MAINALLAAAAGVLLGAAGQPWVYAAVLLGCVVDGIFPPVSQ